MIEGTYTVKPSILKKFKPFPLDKYQAQVTDVDLYKAISKFSGQEEELLNFEFTVLDNKNFDYMEDGEKIIESTRGRRVWKKIRPSLSAGSKKSKASWFYKLVCAIEKKDLSGEELSEIDPNTLVGQQVIIMTEISGDYNNITGFGPIDKPMPDVPNASDRVKEEQENVEPEEVKEEVVGDLPF